MSGSGAGWSGLTVDYDAITSQGSREVRPLDRRSTKGLRKRVSNSKSVSKRMTRDSAGRDCRILALRKYARWPGAADRP